jgi:CBS domain-containing protein
MSNCPVTRRGMMQLFDLTTLSKTPPFSFLPEEKQAEIFGHLSEEKSKKGEVKFVQRQTAVNYLYVISNGSAELYFEQDQEKILRRLLSEGDCFGGISMLANDSLAVRSMTLVEDTTFYKLPQAIFVQLCDDFDDFKEFFTNIFGKKMLDRSYAEILSQQISSPDKGLPFFHQQISSIYNPSYLTCSGATSIRDAACKMTEDDSGYLLVHDKQKRIDGIITDEDLRKRVIAVDFSKNLPVSDIMSTPLISLPEEARVYEAYLLMIEKGISHLAVSKKDGDISGMLTDRQIITEQSRSPYFLIQEIKRAKIPDQLENIHSRLPGIMIEPIKGGVQPDTLSKLITTIADAILEKIITFAVEKAGPPPCGFAFLVMGSEGRNEQTLKTDQDNAIVYQDVEDPEEAKRVQSYFIDLATDICTWLDKAGFVFCEGNNMAQNPDWCQPISVWKRYFHGWIHAANPEDLLKSSIFFDFRWGWGSKQLTDELSEFLFTSLENWSGFFRNMVENALYFKPPLGFFRNIVVQSKGEHKDSFDIKRAMMPIIDFARIYALKHAIHETNTLVRLEKIHGKRLLTGEEYDDIAQSYRYLMNLRFVRQITAITEESGKADNFINPKNLSRIDQTMLKEIFRRVEGIQQKMSIEFTGIV